MTFSAESRRRRGPLPGPLPEWARERQLFWEYRGRARPDFAQPPGPGERSVWDFPRPPRLEEVRARVIVRVAGHTLADTSRSLRVLETASPPGYYIPPEDVSSSWLVPTEETSRCEWKGEARYWSLRPAAGAIERVAWSYEHPFPGFEAIAGYLSFYPARLECTVGSQRVEPQPGDVYGGWVTPELVGPFKGAPGSESW